MSDVGITGILAHARQLAVTRRFYEQQLGLEAVAAAEGWVKYSTGLLELEIRSADHDGVRVDDGVDESALMVFLVSDIDQVRAALEARGVEFQPTLRYEIGATAACFDPDGHNITLYEPSGEAMTWPSAAKIRELAAGSQPTTAALTGHEDGLAPCPLIYLFLFVRDTSEASTFYGHALGFPVLERDDEAGVVKYDAGAVILATHMVGGDAWCAVEMDLTRVKRICPVIEVADVDPVVRRLTRTGIPLAEGRAGTHGVPSVMIQDPNGHRFQLQPGMRKRREDPQLRVG